jgi:uncharacterized lipoprotein YmbA
MLTSFRAIAIFAAAATTAGCSSILAPRPDPARYYVLTSADAPATAVRANAALETLRAGGLRLDSFRLPDLYDRAELVWHTAPNRLAISDTDRWLEPLPKAAARVFAQALAGNTGLDWLPYPPSTGTGREHRLAMDVTQLEIRLDCSEVRLRARWQYVPAASAPSATSAARTGALSLTVPLAASSPEGVAVALSRAFDTLATRVAGEVFGIPAMEKPGFQKQAGPE